MAYRPDFETGKTSPSLVPGKQSSIERWDLAVYLLGENPCWFEWNIENIHFCTPDFPPFFPLPLFSSTLCPPSFFSFVEYISAYSSLQLSYSNSP